MVGTAYNEILEMIMRRLKLRLMTGDLDLNSDSLSFPYEEDVSSKDPTNPTTAGKPKTIKAFEDYDYKLEYNTEDELSKFSSHDKKLEYTLNKDSFGDLTTVSVKTPGLQFKIGLIYENYDIRQNDTQTTEKGKLTDVVLLDMNNQPFSLGLTIIPERKTINEGGSAQYTATLHNADGTTEDVTDECIWTVSDPKYTIINGVISNCQQGSTTVTATLDYDSATANLIVLSYKIVVEPADTVLEIKNQVSQNVQFKAYKVSSDGSKSDITDDPLTTWSHGNQSWPFSNKTLTVNSAGQDSVVASYNGKFGVGKVTATEVNEDFRLEPDTQDAKIGDSPSFKAIYTLNGQEREVTNDAYWTINDPLGVYEINRGKMDTITETRGNNAVPIMATYKGLSTGASVRVPNAQPLGFVIEPKETTIGWGSTVQFRAYRVLQDGSRIDITDQVIWKCSNYRIGGHEYDVGADDAGLVTTDSQIRTEGDATVWAYLGDETATATLHVTGNMPPVQPTYNLFIEPAEIWAKLGDAPIFKALYQSSSGSPSDVSEMAEWSIDYFSISGGQVSQIDDDNNIVATVTAAFDGKTATAQLKVRKPITVNLVIEPNPLNLQVGDTGYIQVKVMEGNTYRDVTEYATLSINKYKIAYNGLISETSVSGIATVTATYGGTTVTGTVNVSYQLANDYLEIVPKELNLPVNAQSQLEAFHVFNGQRYDVTIDPRLSWADENSVTDTSTGIVRTEQVGTGVVIATYVYNGLTRTARCPVVVSSRKPELSIRYNEFPITVGKTKQFYADYSDDTGSNDVTNLCTWTATKSAISSTGLFTAGLSSIGEVTVTARYNGLSAVGSFRVRSESDAVDRRITLKIWDSEGAGTSRIGLYLNGEFKQIVIPVPTPIQIIFTLKQGSNYIRVECEKSPINGATIFAYAKCEAYHTANMSLLDTCYFNFPNLVPNQWQGNQPSTENIGELPGFNWEWYSE